MGTAIVDPARTAMANHMNGGGGRGGPLAPPPPPPLAQILPMRAPDSDDDEEEEDDDDDDDVEDSDWAALCGSHEEVEPSVQDPRDEGTSDRWVRRNPSLIRLTGKHPFNSEPPLPRLMHHGFLTPAPLHYVRNHGPVPRADWSAWTVEVAGLVRRPARLTMDQLVRDFPRSRSPSRSPAPGTAARSTTWRAKPSASTGAPAPSPRPCGAGPASATSCAAAASRARERGPPRALRGRGGPPRRRRRREGVKVRDQPPARGRDGRVARRLAGLHAERRIAVPDHGFPVRVVIPGFIGGRMVKWLRKITVAPEESDSYYHYHDNRVLPSHVDAELAKAEDWWHKPEYIINELNINSVITTPCHDEILPINALTTLSPYTIRGYAYSGEKVTRVEVTLDGGESWVVCAVDHREKPNKFGKYWCWCFWSVDVEILDLLGAKEIAVRAWDESLNTQPEKLIWNVMGMMNNCWFRVKVAGCRPHRGEIGLVFEHPTQPGNQPGGWMAKQKHLETSTATAAAAAARPPTLKKSTSSPFMNTAARQFSMSEVRKHSSADSAWIVIHGHVYDCTAFLKDHPGGADSILINAGTDCTEEFDAIHSDKARAMLDTYRIGELIAAGYASDNSVHGASDFANHLDTIREAARAPAAALVDRREKVRCLLVAKAVVSRDVRLFRFALPLDDQVLGLSVGKHIFLCATVDGKPCMRAYTPTSPVDTVGYFELLIKVYFKGKHPKFPDGGVMSQYLESLPIGSAVDIKGPLGHIEYSGRGNFMVNGKPQFARRLAMIAGGTGITPVYQVIQAVLRDQPDDRTEMHLVYTNRSEDDILLRDELDRWAAAYPDRLRVWYVVDRLSRPDKEWRYSVGFVTEAILQEHVPAGGADDTLALACGPQPMIQFAVLPNLEKMKYDKSDSIFIF
uniref:nitrate reductase (NADH) n=1 Tax=Ananas comosus var. bracteatus TaxID=296719 RepID=A0A6V7P5U1_ANACO|nr:unnamed protein product [Ananas comosus var. bracteatus]